MELTIDPVAGATKISLSGRMDTNGVERVELRFTAAAAGSGGPVIVDLAAVPFLASLGIRMLISTARAVSGRGYKMALFGANDAVMEIIETTSLHELIPVTGTEAEALALISA